MVLYYVQCDAACCLRAALVRCVHMCACEAQCWKVLGYECNAIMCFSYNAVQSEEKRGVIFMHT